MQQRSGDGWVEDSDGRRYWGLFGAAGLLAVTPDQQVLMQHRAPFSHQGGTWALPGGARDAGESAQLGALREAHEEAGVPAEAVEPWFEHLVDLGFWSYTTCVMRVVAEFEPVINDPESLELRWVPIEQVTELDLHPGFQASWPELRERIRRG
ncbi:MAG: NUDIX domain-containing protein [Microbacteriaceae bacterium]